MPVLIADICRFSAGLLISATVEATLLTLALALALRLFPRIPAMLRFTLWIAVLVASITLPFLPLLPHSAAATTQQTMPQAMLHADIRWSFAIAGLWALMSTIRAVQLVCSMVRLRAIARRSVLVESVAGLPGARPVLLCTSDDVVQPSVIGFLSPRILIPTALYPRLSAGELEQIVLHEREHLRRRDDWINLLQKIVLVLFPLNPVLFWVERRLCLERELACDDSVLAATNMPRSYATCLVHLAEERLFSQQLPLALGAWGRKSELTRRVHHILEPTRKRLTQPQSALALALIGSGLAASAAIVVHTPQLVTFGAPRTEPVRAAIETPLPQTTPFRNVNLSATAPHATLVKAVMRTPAPVRAARKVIHRAPAPEAAPQQQQWLMTTWTQTQTVATPMMVSYTDDGRRFTVIQTRQQVSSYAAVATTNGWLIFKL